jgi:hypothetical protein
MSGAIRSPTFAEDVRGQRLPVEQLLVGLKCVWAGLAEVRQLGAHDAGNLLDHLASRCIRAYDGRDELAAPLDRLVPLGSASRLA